MVSKETSEHKKWVDGWQTGQEFWDWDMGGGKGSLSLLNASYQFLILVGGCADSCV